jgi:hypothetical protein
MREGVKEETLGEGVRKRGKEKKEKRKRKGKEIGKEFITD